MDLQDGIIFHKRYRLIKKLGQGAYGEVWLAHDDVMDLEVAIKVYIPLDEKGLENFKADLKTTYALDHPNLLKPYHYDDFDGRPYLIMPYCSKGAASNLPEDVDETTVWRFIRDVATGLAYLHGKTKPIIHQDIKPANILIDNDGNFRIADFGLSKEARHSFSAQSARALSAGSPAYMGPERFSANPKPIMASDIWSLGASLYDLLMRELPFCGFGGGMMNSGAVVPEITADYSDELKETVQACLAKETWERPTTQELADYANAHLKGKIITPPWKERLGNIEKPKQVEPKAPDPKKTQPFVAPSVPKPKLIMLQDEPKPNPPKPTPKPPVKYTFWSVVVGVLVVGLIVFGITGLFGGASSEEVMDTLAMDTVAIEHYEEIADSAEAIVYGSLTPNWSSSATAEQRRILGALIDNMVAVKGGTFTMGATSEQGSEAESVEKPTHRVTLSDYHIGKYEVTQEEWQAVMGKNPSYFKGSKRPVEKVSYKDCGEFIRRLNALTGLEFMLPTEAQWEYASRGGNMSRGYKFSGDNTIDNVAWYSSNSGSETHPVGQKKPNELGLYDMSGNVYEWCSDAWYSYDSNSATDPKHKGDTGSDRVFRGGSWRDIARLCRVSNRDGGSPGYSSINLGLRLVCP